MGFERELWTGSPIFLSEIHKLRCTKGACLCVMNIQGFSTTVLLVE